MTTTVGVTYRLKLLNLVFQFKQVMVSYMWSDNPHGICKTEKILVVATTRTNGAVNLLSNVRKWCWSNKERIRWRTNVDVQLKWRTHVTVGWIERDINSLVSSNFTHVEMPPNSFFLGDRNFIGNAPDLFLHHRANQPHVTNRQYTDYMCNIGKYYIAYIT